MKAMVLAAGKGERMRPLTDLLPKPLLPIANRPAMGYVLENLARHGFTEVIANLHYRARDISDCFGDGSAWGVSLVYSYEDELLGSAGSVMNCRDFLGDDTFLVTGADDLTDMNLTALLEAHRKAGAVASIALVEVEQTSEYGIVVTDDAGRIQQFVEKPKGLAPSRLANTQIYLFEPEVLGFIPEETFYDFGRQVFPAMVEAGVPFYGFKLDGYWRDVGSLADYLAAQVDALQGRLPARLGGSEVSPGIWLGAGCTVDSQARLEAPVILGEHCRIGAGARLRGGTAIGDGAEVPAGSDLCNSVLWPETVAPAGEHLCRAVVTPHAGVVR